MPLPVDFERFVPTLSWNSLSALIALGLAVYGGWSLSHDHNWQDAFVVLLGLYLAALELPLAIPALGLAVGATCPLSGNLVSKVTTIAPAAVLFLLSSIDYGWFAGAHGNKRGG